MGKKKRGHPDIEDILYRPWCYYCERDFEDLKLLISHQKAKHFKCDRCGRRLNTAGGLSVHMNQVHKETLEHVENALPNRQGLEVEIFGMEGIPAETLDAHRNRLIQNFYQAQEERRLLTGNPVPGQPKPQRKKLKMENAEELKARLAIYRKMKKEGGIMEGVQQTPAAYQSPVYPQPQPPAPVQQPFAYDPSSMSTQPSGPSGLPQRPGEAPAGDDIDNLIRMAEAGVRHPQEAEGAAAPEPEAAKAGKKGTRMFYDDPEISPEERMALLPKYAFAPAV